MNSATESIDEPRISASTLRVRRHRERRREGLRLLTLEMSEPAIETAIARGRPSCFPSSLALLRPARSRSWIIERSNSANTPIS